MCFPICTSIKIKAKMAYRHIREIIILNKYYIIFYNNNKTKSYLNSSIILKLGKKLNNEF